MFSRWWRGEDGEGMASRVHYYRGGGGGWRGLPAGGDLYVDFSPKGGPKALRARCEKGGAQGGGGGAGSPTRVMVSGES